MKAEADRQDQVSTADTERNSGPAGTCAEADLTTRARTKAEAAASSLMEAVVERGNLKLAYQRVMANKGAAGVDALTVSAFKAHLQQHWPTIKGRLLAGTYQPQPVRRVDIPKPQGGVRTLAVSAGVMLTHWRCGRNLGLPLEVVHVLIGRPNPRGQALHQAGKAHRGDDPTVGLPDEELSEELASGV